MSNLGVLGFLGRYFYRYRPIFVSYALLLETDRKGRNTMEVKMRYENTYQTIEVETKDLEEWLNISIIDDESESDYEKRIQNEIEVQFNRPDYNNWHQYDRHLGNSKVRPNDETDGLDVSELLMDEVLDSRIFCKESIERENQWEYEAVCMKLREALKPDIADMVISIVLDGQRIAEYATSVGDKANNVSHRYRRALNTLKKVFLKTSF